jgi:hypothetical protein
VSGRGAAVLLALMAACSAPARRPPQLPNARAELQLTGSGSSNSSGTLDVRVASVDGQVVRGAAIELPPGEHDIAVRIVWNIKNRTEPPVGEVSLHGRLDDGHRYQVRASWTPKDSVRVELVDEGDGHTVVSRETKLTGGGA